MGAYLQALLCNEDRGGTRCRGPGVGSRFPTRRDGVSLPCAADRHHVRGLEYPERAKRRAYRVGDIARRQVAVMLLDLRVSAWPNCAAITASGTPRIARRLA